MKLQKMRFYIKSKVRYKMEPVSSTTGYYNSGIRYVTDCIDRMLKGDHPWSDIYKTIDREFYIRLETDDRSDERHEHSTNFSLYIGWNRNYRVDSEVCFGDYTLYSSNLPCVEATREGIEYAISVFEEAKHVN